MLGTTETVFEHKPSDEPERSRVAPMSVLKLQASAKEQASSGELSRNAGPPKIKRPMETNRLEHGPPKAKIQHVDDEGARCASPPG